ncbi:hypothetical protein CKA32_007110 [Geitlerinema sp. FC II]|nr:hypothetical protein CKA32_007110 [Geitlerinema sp. FC II]
MIRKANIDFTTFNAHHYTKFTCVLFRVLINALSLIHI